MKSVYTANALLSIALLAGHATASVFMPYNSVKSSQTHQYRSSSSFETKEQTAARTDLRLALHQHKKALISGSSSSSIGATSSSAQRFLAMAIPGYGVAEQVLVGGFANFLSIYNLVITARILLSWFPQAQGIGLLQPVYAVTDPYLNLFRGILPPIFGLDLSPILAFFLLSVLGNATAAVGAETPPHLNNRLPVFGNHRQHRRFGLFATSRKEKRPSFGSNF
jgi:YggT family protein